jgi:hypothetical protein
MAGIYNYGLFHMINHNEIGYAADLTLVFIFYCRPPSILRWEVKMDIYFLYVIYYQLLNLFLFSIFNKLFISFLDAIALLHLDGVDTY